MNTHAGLDTLRREAQGRLPAILLVDDDEIDRMSFRRAFKRQGLSNSVVEAEDGVVALDILLGRNGKEALAKPYLIILDLNMPRMNGLEFLGEIRRHPVLASSVVFVSSTSKADEDLCAAYAQNVAGYIVKGGAESAMDCMIQLLDCYSRAVALP